jgi:cell division protein FtsL
MSVLHYFFLVVIVSVFAIVGAAQRSRAVHLGYDLEHLQSKRQFLANDSRTLDFEISSMTQPARTAEAIAKHRLDLENPLALAEADGPNGGNR